MDQTLGIMLTALLGFVLLYLMVFALVEGDNKAVRKMERAMTSKEKKALRKTISDLITNAFEDAEHDKKITKDQKLLWYQKIGSRCDLYDLLPKKLPVNYPDPDTLKNQLKARIKAKMLKKEPKNKLDEALYRHVL